MTKCRAVNFRRWALSGCAALALIGAAGPVLADAPRPTAVETVQFQIPQQSLATALSEFARQSGRQLLFAPEIAAGKTANAVVGRLNPLAAFDLLIAGTGLKYTLTNAGAILLRDPSRTPARAAEGEGADGGSQADVGDAKAPSDKDEQTAQDGKVERVVVTGSRIRGTADQFSPVTRVSRDKMDQAGNATVFDAIGSLPQNFAGGASPDTSRAGSISGAGAAGVNLRGLGNEATLVLLNGRRLAPGGGTGGFVDISAIPVTVIDRIEVLPDGASAIYGSDAIAGVVNIITRNDFQGAETRVGWSTAGGNGDIMQIGQTAGWADADGHLLLSYQYTTADELDQNDRDFARGTLPDPNYLLPFSQTNSLFASGGLQLSNRVSLSGDAYYNKRYSKTARGDDFGVPIITRQAIDVEQYGAAAGLDIELDGGWRGEISGAYSSSHHQGAYDQDGFGNTDDAVTSIAAVDASISGPLFQIAANGPIQAVLGVHYREEVADIISLGVPSGNITSAADKSRSVGAAFAEVYAPLVSEGDSVLGVHRLALTGALRYEHYSDLGTSIDPRAGLVYAPFPGLTLRGTWGTAFRAPRLEQMLDQVYSFLGIYEDSSLPGGEAVALVMGGKTANLRPEQAETWTAGFDWKPEQIDGFQLRATYFNVNYSDRVGFPSFGFNSAFHFVDFTGPVQLNPDPGAVADIVSRSTFFFNYADFFPIGPLAVGDVTALLDSRAQNLSASMVEGFDVGATLALENWSLFANLTWLTGFTQQVTPVSPELDLLNTYGNPVDLRMQAGVQWSDEVLTASLTANYVDSYRDDETTSPGFRIDSWSTLDAGLRVDLGNAFVGSDFAQGMSVSLTVNNLLDEDPPAIGPRLQADLPYDASNADPTGRRIRVLLSKQW